MPAPKAHRVLGFRSRTLAVAMMIMLLTLTLAGCGSGSEKAALPGQLKAWVDAPLDQMTIPLAPYQIVCHGTDAGGVARMELTINDVAEADEAVEAHGSLATLRHMWTPPGPGIYKIRVRAQNLAGEWSTNDMVTVFVATGPEASTTAANGVLPATTNGASGATTTPAGGNEPQPAAGETAISQPQLSTDHFYYRYCGGSPLLVTITVSVSDPTGISGVVVHYRLRNKTTGQLSSWFDKQMTSVGGNYQVTLNAENDFNLKFVGFDNTVQYQFVATNSSGAATSSALYDNLSLTGCGARVPPR